VRVSEPDLRIPKIPVTVELNLDGKEIRRVEVFVAEHLADSYRRQHVADLLASAEQWHPAHDIALDSFALFNKAIAVWIRVPLTDGNLPVEETDLTDELFDNRHAVTVVMTTGESLEGELLYSLPKERSRPVDYLNQSGRFFRLWTATHLYLVNTGYVIRVADTKS